MSTPSMSRARLLRVMANTLSAAVFLFVMLFVFGEGVHFRRLTPMEGMEFTAFALMLAGLLLALVRPRIGGLLTLGAFAAFWGVNIFATGATRLGGAFALFPIAAVLQLASWWHGRGAADAHLT